MRRLLYGVVYYTEYMPDDRLDQDIRLMRDAGINVVRIAESTWSTYEPQTGVFDFSSVERVLDAMHAARHRGHCRNADLCHSRLAGQSIPGCAGCNAPGTTALRKVGCSKKNARETECSRK